MKKIIFLLVSLFTLTSCNFNKPDEPKIDFSLSANKTTLNIDEKTEVTITLKYSTDITRAKFTYKSSDDKVLEATNYSDCVVTLLAHNLGSATITITETTYQISHSIDFVVEPAFEGKITLNQKLINIKEKETFQLIVIENQRDVDWKSADESIATVSKDGLVTAVSSGSTIITACYHLAPNITTECQVIVYDEYIPSKVEMKQTYKDYAKNGYWPQYSSTPASGDIKLLIVPIWFDDSYTFITNDTYKEYVREDIETAYLGTNEEIGYRSVKTYYEEESSGKLSIDGYVTNWYNTNNSSFNYASDSTQTVDLLRDVVDWLKNDTSIDITDYDSDKDGYLDGVIMIYARPAYPRLGQSKNNFWAYCGHDTNMNSDIDSPNGNVYFWASYDFIYANYEDRTTARTGSYYGGGNTFRQIVDPITYIHEMGHMFGLYDYYDYTYSVSPAGVYTMQDENVSTHDPFSYIALNWADPYIPAESCTITIGEFATTHDVILLTPEWNEYDSVFDEYILLELYNLTGLNEYYKDDWFKGIMLPDGIGIRVWHVDARLVANPAASALYREVTSNVNDSRGVYKMCDNSHAKINNFPSDQRGSFLYENQNMLQLISRSNRNFGNMYRGNPFDNNDLFVEDDTFTLENFKKQFTSSAGDYYTDDAEDVYLNNGKKLNWSFTVDKINTIDGFSTATLTLNKLSNI